MQSSTKYCTQDSKLKHYFVEGAWLGSLSLNPKIEVFRFSNRSHHNSQFLDCKLNAYYKKIIIQAKDMALLLRQYLNHPSNGLHRY